MRRTLIVSAMSVHPHDAALAPAHAGEEGQKCAVRRLRPRPAGKSLRPGSRSTAAASPPRWCRQACVDSSWAFQKAETMLVPMLQRRYSVVKVESSDMYERGRPKVGGLNDLALGTMDRQERCTTDSANAQVPLHMAAST